MPAALRHRLYRGVRRPNEAGPAVVTVHDSYRASRRLRQRHDIRQHSDGFQWGYAGSGPAQLSLALLADALGDDELAQRHYQRFKFDRIAKIDEDGWQIAAGEIQDAVATYEQEAKV